MMLTPERRLQLREQRRQAKRAALEFERVCKLGNFEALLEVATLVDQSPFGSWRLAMQRVAAIGSVSKDIQYAFVAVWTERAHLPLMVGDRPTMVRALRVLLPRRKPLGPVHLYRGTTPDERRCHLYGFSWTSNRDFAESFARDQNCDGAVVLETLAEVDAVMYVCENIVEGFDESEYIVDPYKLTKVNVLLRLPAPPPDVSCDVPSC